MFGITRSADLALAAGLILAAPAALAQSRPAAAYVVTYVEVAPVQTDAALALLRQAATTMRALPGNHRFDLLQRIDRPNHFSIVELWETQAAAEASRAAGRFGEFRAALAPMQTAPYDERPHSTLSVGPADAARPPGTLYAVTHVDIIPTMRDHGVAVTASLADRGRAAEGNLRFDALLQNSRMNHMTLVEAWASPAALAGHIGAATTRSYRDGLLPMSGSLYDERLYHLLD